jgi:hypothetical protein
VCTCTSSRSVSYCRLWARGCSDFASRNFRTLVSLFRSTISIHPTRTINYISSSCGRWAGGCSDSASRNPRTACTSRYPCTPRQMLAFAYTVSIRLACYLWARCRAVHINSQNRSSSYLLHDISHGRLPLWNGFTRPTMYTSYSCFLVELDD